MAQTSSSPRQGHGLRGPSNAGSGSTPPLKIERRRPANGFPFTEHYARRDVVIEEAEPANHLFKVIAGTLRATKLLPDGRRHITSFVSPGDFFGFTNNGHYLQTVDAIEDTALIRYSRRGLEHLMETDPQTRYCLYVEMRKALLAADEHLLLLGRKNAVERVAAFLLSLAGRVPTTEHCGPKEIVLRMNRSDIADYLGLSVETVSRTFTRLCRRKIISLPTPERVVLVRRDALQRISDCLS